MSLFIQYIRHHFCCDVAEWGSLNNMNLIDVGEKWPNVTVEIRIEIRRKVTLD